MTTGVAAPSRRDLWRMRLSGSVASITITFIIMLAVGLIWVGPRFVSASNISIIGAFLVVPMIVGACAGFALLAGVVDLSVGSMVGFSSALFALQLAGGSEPLPSAMITLAACLCAGGLNALAIVRFGADAIAATLGMLTALRGMTWVIVGFAGASGGIFAFNAELFALANARLVGLPALFLAAIGLTLVATIIVSRTRLGRHIQAVGGDDKAAGRAGIPVGRLRTFALLLSALGGGVAGIVLVSQLGSAAMATGFGLEFQVYAALMIGGYSILRGGVGNPIGGLLGLFVVAGVSNMLELKAVSPYYTNIIVGVLLLGAVLLDRLRGGDPYE